jgi:hypothetical protein
MSKWFLRSRGLLTILSLVLGMLGAPAWIIDGIPMLQEALPEVLPYIEGAITVMTPLALYSWQRMRPDEAKLTLLPKKTNAPVKLPGRKP